MDHYLTKPYSITDISQVLSQFSEQNPTIPHSKPDNVEEPPQISEISSADNEVFDLAAIESIKAIEEQTGNPLIQPVFDGFVGQMQEKLTALDSQFKSDNFEEIPKTAHAIKSMSANLGAKQLRLLSAKLEHDLKNGKLSEIEHQVLEISNAYDEFIYLFDNEFLK